MAARKEPLESAQRPVQDRRQLGQQFFGQFGILFAEERGTASGRSSRNILDSSKMRFSRLCER